MLVVFAGWRYKNRDTSANTRRITQTRPATKANSACQSIKDKAGMPFSISILSGTPLSLSRQVWGVPVPTQTIGMEFVPFPPSCMYFFSNQGFAPFCGPQLSVKGDSFTLYFHSGSYYRALGGGHSKAQPSRYSNIVLSRVVPQGSSQNHFNLAYVATTTFYVDNHG